VSSDQEERKKEMAKEKKKSVVKDDSEITGELLGALLQPNDSPEYQKATKKLKEILGLDVEFKLVSLEEAMGRDLFLHAEEMVAQGFGEMTLREAADYLKVTQYEVLRLTDRRKLSIRHLPKNTSTDGQVDTMILVSAVSISFYKAIQEAIRVMDQSRESVSASVPVKVRKIGIEKLARDVLPPEEFQKRFGRENSKTVQSQKPCKGKRKEKK